jgi:hypothetical protein
MLGLTWDICQVLLKNSNWLSFNPPPPGRLSGPSHTSAAGEGIGAEQPKEHYNHLAGANNTGTGPQAAYLPAQTDHRRR